MNNKTFLKTLFSLCLMALCWMPVNAQKALDRGDVDGDGAVGIADVSALIDYLLSGDESSIRISAADVDRDGEVGISDVSALIDYLLLGEWGDEPELPPYEPVYETFTVSGVTFRMVKVEGGTFMMGARDFDPYVRPWESPAHEVTLSDYYIAETEVTQALYRAVVGSNPSWFTSTNGYTTDLQRPVEKVTYSNCQSFITKLKQKTGKNFRLVTEAEWEYAARGGKYSKGYMYAGSNNLDEVAWYIENSGEVTHAVTTKAPNELGIYGMSGNVDEWTADWFGTFSASPQTNPTGPTSGTARVVRGGSWNQAFRMSRPTSRKEGFPTSDNVNTGFRIALDM